jgi:hypothetical protein
MSLDLPGRQPDLIKALARRAPELPLVVVLMHGGGIDVEWMQQLPGVKSILSVPFPGQVRYVSNSPVSHTQGLGILYGQCQAGS